jgi:hypothetical protein
MDQLDHAIHNTAHKSSKTPEEIARAISVGHQILLNKVSPTNDRNKLTLREAVAMIICTGNTEMVSVIADIAGGEFVPRGGDATPSVMSGVLTVVSEQGDVTRAIECALADGRISSREGNRIIQEIDQAMSALRLLRKAVGDVVQGKVVDLSAGRG